MPEIMQALRKILERDKIKKLTKINPQLVLDNKLNISDLIKNPIMIRNNSNYEIINERILHKLIIEDIEFVKNI